jgi:hypothetical protein
MKKLLLTLAVVGLASNAFAIDSKTDRNDPSKPKTESDKREDAKKAHEVTAAGTTAEHTAVIDIANNIIKDSKQVQGSGEVKDVREAFAKAVKDGILTLKDLQTIENNAKSPAVNAYLELLIAAAKKGTLDEGLAKFGRVEVINKINGTTVWEEKAETKLIVTLVEATRSLQDGDAKTSKQAILKGLDKAGIKDASLIKDILEKCFGIV